MMEQYREVSYEVNKHESEPYHILRIYKQISENNFELIGGHRFFKNAPCIETIRETIDEIVYDEISEE